MGLLRLANICEEGQRLSQTAPFTLEGVVFGSDDFCADIGKFMSLPIERFLRW